MHPNVVNMPSGSEVFSRLTTIGGHGIGGSDGGPSACTGRSAIHESETKTYCVGEVRT
jgi:hypothetical protein